MLFVLYQGMPSTANKTDGIWEYNAKAQSFNQRLKLWRHANLDKGSGVRAGRVLFSAGAGYVVSFDLEHNRASLLSDPYPIGPDLKTPDLDKRREPFPAFPYLSIDGWLWTTHPFGRKSTRRSSGVKFFHPSRRPSNGPSIPSCRAGSNKSMTPSSS